MTTERRLAGLQKQRLLWLRYIKLQGMITAACLAGSFWRPVLVFTAFCSLLSLDRLVGQVRKLNAQIRQAQEQDDFYFTDFYPPWSND